MARPKLPDKIGSSEMARCLGVTTRRLNQLVDDGVLTKEGRGSFPVVANIKAFLDFKVRTAVDQAIPTATENVQKLKEQVLSRKLARDDRDLITLEEARSVLEDVAGHFLSCLSGLPARLARRNLQERRRIEKLIDGERERLARDFAKSAGSLQTGVPAAEASGTDDT